MKQLLHENEIAGLTIERTLNDDYGNFYLVFTDKTFCKIWEEGYGERSIEICSHKIPSAERSSKNELEFLVELGCLTKEQLNEEIQLRGNRRKSYEENQEIEQLRKLAAKYPTALENKNDTKYT
jgi:hypothetical protein